MQEGARCLLHLDVDQRLRLLKLSSVQSINSSQGPGLGLRVGPGETIMNACRIVWFKGFGG